MAAPDQIARLRNATGLGWLAARLFFGGKSTTLCERILLARETQTGRLLHDPIEDDSALNHQFEDAKIKSEASFENWVANNNAQLIRLGLTHMVSKHPRGGCHFRWRQMKTILQEQHGIGWFTPAEMNPGIRFD